MKRRSLSKQPGLNQRSRGAIILAWRYRHFRNARFSNSAGEQVKRSQKSDLRSRVEVESEIVIAIRPYCTILTTSTASCGFLRRMGVPHFPDRSLFAKCRTPPLSTKTCRPFDFKWRKRFRMPAGAHVLSLFTRFDFAHQTGLGFTSSNTIPPTSASAPTTGGIK